LPQIKNRNAQKEYYVTDIFAQAVKEKIAIKTFEPRILEEILGVNDHEQLAYLERFWQASQTECCLQAGLALADPTRFDLRGELAFSRDVFVDIGVILEGVVSLGENSRVGAYSHLKNVIVGKNVEIKSHCVIEEAVIDDDCVVGPFARIRPGTRLAKKAHVGNFVEIKKSVIGEGSKVNHLSYIGDAIVGARVNVGAGTITCNYDGVHKHKTEIEDGAFIGSNTALVAPVKIGKKATIGAGSVITQNAPAEKLTVARARQTTIDRWKPPEKE
jgi:bifunctional UDP-N-acetylglucosamine pyrophosphorylase/glucosamine-1-phosphate N-acetyltransferase